MSDEAPGLKDGGRIRKKKKKGGGREREKKKKKEKLFEKWYEEI